MPDDAEPKLFRPTYPDRHGRRRTARKWYVQWRDHNDAIRRWPAYTDKRSSRDFGRKLQLLAAYRRTGEPFDAALMTWLETLPPELIDKLAAIGILDKRRHAATKTLDDHLDDWKKWLEARDDNPRHVKETVARARKLVNDCGFTMWNDISPQRVTTELADKRVGTDKKPGIGPRTSNSYLQSLKQFCRWMVDSVGRAAQSPVAQLRPVNQEVDRRRERRALSVEELQRIVKAAEVGPVIRGLTGRDRATIYRLVMETGLRWSEVKGLTRDCFDLEAEEPTLTVKAAYSKHRRQDILPLRPRMAALLKDYLADRAHTDKAFPTQPWCQGVYIFGADLAATATGKLKDGETPDPKTAIQYRDADGRYADFHSLRHSFLTALSRSGASPKQTQALARHQTSAMTDRYIHMQLTDQRAGLESLPDLDAAPESVADEKRATGTDDAVASVDEAPEDDQASFPMLAQNGPKADGNCEELRDKEEVPAGTPHQEKEPENTEKSGVFRPSHSGDPDGTRTHNIQIDSLVL
jgi:integrase